MSSEDFWPEEFVLLASESGAELCPGICSVGTFENSPAFLTPGTAANAPSSEGTTDRQGAIFSRSFGTGAIGLVPGNELPGYYQTSLRDEGGF